MKKENQTEKKLSLKKLQMIKISNMKTIYGGSVNTLGFDANDVNDGPDKTIKDKTAFKTILTSS